MTSSTLALLASHFKLHRIFLHSSPVCFKNLPENWKQNRLRTIRDNYLRKMANSNPEIDKILSTYREAVKKQGDLVRQLKESGGNEMEIKEAVRVLKLRKKELENKELSLVPEKELFEKARLEDLLKRRFFYDLSFSIYGGISGLFDYGPMGCAMKKNLLNQWIDHFIREDDLLEVDCSMITPKCVLEASGHVERFADLMVKDKKTGECFRLDHVIKNHFNKLVKDTKLSPEKNQEYQDILTKLDDFKKDQMNAILIKYNIKAPLTGNDFTEPEEFNLMFKTYIGNVKQDEAFLRPETAQGIFVNFQKLLSLKNGRLPFGVAQIGNSFRNEISPRSGLIRVREFTMGEIEYFLDPKDKDHPKFNDVKDMKVNLYSACNQMDGKSAEMVTMGDAVAKKIIANETLAYYMARIYTFMLKAGVDSKKLRFRQHMSNEMAHYACDCWDAECLTSFGWVECVGCADRSCYDLNQHTNATGTKLVVKRGDEEIVPNVIEPSFGIGRIIYSILEHSFKIRVDDPQRTYLSLPPSIAPIKCAILPLSGNQYFAPFIKYLSLSLKNHQISFKIDESGVSIGRRYARADEIAIPFAATIDFDTLKAPYSVTLRERDSTSQIRLSIESVGALLRDLCSGKKTWDDATNEFPIFEQQEMTKTQAADASKRPEELDLESFEKILNDLHPTEELSVAASLRISGHLKPTCTEELFQLLKENFYFDQSFTIYDGVEGLFDFGPLGCSLKRTILEEWTNHLVAEENLMEVDCSILTPEFVFKAYGSVEEKLLFKTSIGPGEANEKNRAFLRPDLSYGVYVNFKRLLGFNNGKLPFGVSQIGSAFSSKSSNLSGLVNAKEFPMAQIFYFIDPEDKKHPKLERIINISMCLYTLALQKAQAEPIHYSIGYSLQENIIRNETLAFFMGQIYSFLLKIGINSNKIRFKETTEIPNGECWIAECLTSQGWIECVRCADRGCNDLVIHSKASNTKLVSEKSLDQPITVEVTEYVPQKVAIGQSFKGDSKTVLERLSNLSLEEKQSLESSIQENINFELSMDNKKFIITPTMVTVKRFSKKVQVKEVTPCVVESSLLVGPVMQCLMEHQNL